MVLLAGCFTSATLHSKKEKYGADYYESYTALYKQGRVYLSGANRH